MEPSSQNGDSFEVERDRSRKIWSSVFSVVERGQSQSSGVLVYSVVVTDLNQNPGALTYCFSVEEKDLNQMLFGRHLWSRAASWLQNGPLLAVSVEEKGQSPARTCCPWRVVGVGVLAHSGMLSC